MMAMILRLVFGFWVLSVGVQATGCQDLCHVFGDEVGCQRLAAGEKDCTYPVRDASRTPHGSSAETRVDEGMSQSAHFYTRWKHQGRIRMRFEVTVERDGVAVVGQAEPSLDPYFVRFTPNALTSDHILDEEARCQKVSKGRYQCRDTSSGKQSTVVYQRTKSRVFDLKVYHGTSTDQSQLAFRLYGDGQEIHMRTYRGGKPIPSTDEHNFIAR
jgi:hypothetical protein